MEIPCHQIHHGGISLGCAKFFSREGTILFLEIEYEMLQVFYKIAFKEPKPMMVDSGVDFYRVRVRLNELRWLYGTY